MNFDAPKKSHPSLDADILQARLIAFVKLVRANGFQVGTTEAINTQLTAYICNITNLEHLYWGLRSLLCSNQNDWQRFRELFNSYWLPIINNRRIRTKSTLSASLGKHQLTEHGNDIMQTAASDSNYIGRGDGEDASNSGVREGASYNETLARSDFGFIADNDKMDEMNNLIERLAKKMRLRITRRQKIKSAGKRIDIRKTVRNSLRYGGTPLKLAFSSNRKKQTRLIMLVDVSRSMSLYSYVFLRFARGIVNTFKDADAFAFHTRIVHITDALNQANVNKVKAKLSLISAGWSGGTRIGQSLKSFFANYKHRLNSNTVVAIISDGLDTGKPQLLGEQLQLIKSRCRKLIWLNPLLGRAGYETKTGGMLAALPYIDLFASAHNLESLCNLEKELIRV